MSFLYAPSQVLGKLISFISGHVAKNDNKFFTAPPSDRSALTLHRAFKNLSKVFKCHITCRMTICVIYLFEEVKVQHQ